MSPERRDKFQYPSMLSYPPMATETPEPKRLEFWNLSWRLRLIELGIGLALGQINNSVVSGVGALTSLHAIGGPEAYAILFKHRKNEGVPK